MFPYFYTSLFEICMCLENWYCDMLLLTVISRWQTILFIPNIWMRADQLLYRDIIKNSKVFLWTIVSSCTKLYNSILHCTWRTPLSWIAGTFAFREETTDGCLGPFWALLKKYLKKDIYRTACIMSNAFKTAASNLIPLNKLTAYIYTYRLST